LLTQYTEKTLLGRGSSPSKSLTQSFALSNLRNVGKVLHWIYYPFQLAFNYLNYFFIEAL